MPRLLFAFSILLAAALVGCSARLLVDGDLNADSARPHPAAVLLDSAAGD